jgi:hypothetical protein
LQIYMFPFYHLFIFFVLAGNMAEKQLLSCQWDAVLFLRLAADKNLLGKFSAFFQDFFDLVSLLFCRGLPFSNESVVAQTWSELFRLLGETKQIHRYSPRLVTTHRLHRVLML